MFELASVDGTRMLEWAKNVNRQAKELSFQLSEDDKMISKNLDVWAKEIGEGKRPARELSAYLQKVIQPEVYDAPQDLLNRFFMDNPTIGEFDDWTIDKAPKNTLQAYESAKSGNVDKSYIDFEKITPVTKHLQVETELKMADLRKGGFKTVAKMVEFAVNELRNKMFFLMFETIDSTIVAGAQTASDTTTVSETSMDKMAKYLRGYTDDATSISSSSRAYEISKLASAVDFYSEAMKNQLNTNGIVSFYNGVSVAEIKASQETGNGEKLINANRVYGIGGQIGEKALKGALRVLPTEDNKNEVIELKFTGFEFTYAITYPEKVFKISIS